MIWEIGFGATIRPSILGWVIKQIDDKFELNETIAVGCVCGRQTARMYRANVNLLLFLHSTTMHCNIH